MKRKWILTLLFISLIFCFCKKAEPIGKGYVLQSGLCLHSSNKLQSECLEKLEEGNVVEILKYKVPDTEVGENLLWYLVNSGKNQGYISMNEEVTRNMFASIFPNTSRNMIVSASSLRLRATPSLLGEILEMLPNGTEVTIQGKTPFNVKIDGKYDGWVEIVSPSGKRGFSFAGFLKYPPETFGDDSEFTGDSITGFIVIRNPSATLWEIPEKTKWDGKNSCDRGMEGQKLNIQDMYLVAVEKTKLNGVVYYKGNRHFYGYTDVSQDDYGCVSFWVAEPDLEYSNESMFEWSKKKYGISFDQKLLQHLSKQENPLEDISTLSVAEINQPSNSGETLYEISYDSYDDNFNKRRGSIHQLYLKNSSGYFLLLDNIQPSSKIDLDGDGIYEWKVVNSFRSDSETKYYYRSGNTLKEFFSMTQSDMTDCDGITSNGDTNIEYCRLEESPPYIIITKGKKIKKYKYSNGKVTLVK